MRQEFQAKDGGQLRKEESRWLKENYKSYRVNLRYDTDQAIIDYMEQHKSSEGVTPIIREAPEALAVVPSIVPLCRHTRAPA